jgi:hypothetical protein
MRGLRYRFHQARLLQPTRWWAETERNIVAMKRVGEVIRGVGREGAEKK